MKLLLKVCGALAIVFGLTGCPVPPEDAGLRPLIKWADRQAPNDCTTATIAPDDDVMCQYVNPTGVTGDQLLLVNAANGALFTAPPSQVFASFGVSGTTPHAHAFVTSDPSTTYPVASSTFYFRGDSPLVAPINPPSVTSFGEVRQTRTVKIGLITYDIYNHCSPGGGAEISYTITNSVTSGTNPYARTAFSATWTGTCNLATIISANGHELASYSIVNATVSGYTQWTE